MSEDNLDTIITQSRGKDFVDIENELILEDTARTRIVFKASMHSGGIRGDIIRYRKGQNGECEEIVPVNFNSLHSGEGVKITLSTEATKSLYEKIKELETILIQQGVNYGVRNYSLVDKNALIINEENKAHVIQSLLDANYEEDIWNQLSKCNPSIASRLAHANIQEGRLSVLSRFKEMLDNDELSESDWQSFFEENTWIFGFGLRYQILNIVQAQPNYGGQTLDGRGGQRGDFLTATEAETKFTCLVEIKKPSTLLLHRDPYRNGVWAISSELAGAVSQVQVNCAQWEISGSREEHNRETLREMATISPKGIVVIGKTSELNNWDKKNSFERFRQSIHRPEIVTYDELYERAKFIVGEPTNDYGEIDDDSDLPF